jgi:hypothetical protein
MKRNDWGYTKEFKLEALQLAASSGRPPVEIKCELGIIRRTGLSVLAVPILYCM